MSESKDTPGVIVTPTPPAAAPSPHLAAVVVILALGMIGAGFVVAGTFVLFGLGWALLAAGAPFIALAVILRAGLNG